jgi:hypothetical protein
MVLPTQIQDRKPVGQGVLLDGRYFAVQEVTHTTPIGKNRGNKSVAMDITGNDQFPDETIGFDNVNDVQRFLTSRNVEKFTTFDAYGNEQQIERQGLGVPTGMFSLEGVKSESSSSSSGGSKAKSSSKSKTQSPRSTQTQTTPTPVTTQTPNADTNTPSSGDVNTPSTTVSGAAARNTFGQSSR